jgi:copper chaperone
VFEERGASHHGKVKPFVQCSTLPCGKPEAMGWPALPPASALEKTMKYSVSPLTCGSCVGRITEALQSIDSGARIHVDMAAGTVDVDGFFDVGVVVSTLAKIGYEAVPATDDSTVASQDGCCGTCHA